MIKVCHTQDLAFKATQVGNMASRCHRYQRLRESQNNSNKKTLNKGCWDFLGIHLPSHETDGEECPTAEEKMLDNWGKKTRYTSKHQVAQCSRITPFRLSVLGFAHEIRVMTSCVWWLNSVMSKRIIQHRFYPWTILISLLEKPLLFWLVAFPPGFVLRDVLTVNYMTLTFY